jgi:Skp family chaperone for outer membrane proteins
MSTQKFAIVALLSAVAFVGFSVVSTKNEEPKATASKLPEPTFDKVASKADLKIRYVNVFGAMQDSREGSEAAAKVEDRRKEYAASIESKAKKFETAANEFKSKAATMNEASRTKRAREMEDMKRDYENFLQDCEKEMQLAMQQVTEALAKEVETAVADLAKKEGLDAVVDKITGRTIWSSDKADLTGQVVQSMNQRYAYKLAHNEKSAASLVAKKTA